MLCVLGSETYQEAIRDIKLLFPEGVCCPPSMDLKAEEVYFTRPYIVQGMCTHPNKFPVLSVESKIALVSHL